MKRPAVFFDRDNTLISCDEYLGDPAKVELVDGAAEAVARARRLGYATVTVSNQSGVARGYFSEQAVHAVNQRLDELLADGNPKAVIDRHEFCPFHPEASIEKYRCESDKRKPAPGMLLSAAEALALDLSRSWMIGDSPRDIDAGHAAGCRTILFVDPKLKLSPAALAEKKIEPDYVCSTLKEAMDFVEAHTERPADEVDLTPDAKGDVGESENRASVSPAAPELWNAAPRPAASEESVPADDESRMKIPLPEPTLAMRVPARETVLERIEHPEPTLPLSPPATTPLPTQLSSLAKLENLTEQILHEMRRRHEQPVADFSVSKLMAGIVQVLVLFVLFLSYLNPSDSNRLLSLLLLALTLQTMTIALLIMGRQR